MISIIAAIGMNNELGKDNKLLFSLPGDMKFFKETTTNHKIIMGLNTYKSLGRVLPNRENIVISDKDIVINNAKVYTDINKLLSDIMGNKEEIFIIGGASIYNYFIDKADRLYITHVFASKDADVYFPFFDINNYNSKLLGIGIDNDIKYKHILYERKEKK